MALPKKTAAACCAANADQQHQQRPPERFSWRGKLEIDARSRTPRRPPTGPRRPRLPPTVSRSHRRDSRDCNRRATAPAASPNASRTSCTTPVIEPARAAHHVAVGQFHHAEREHGARQERHQRRHQGVLRVHRQAVFHRQEDEHGHQRRRDHRRAGPPGSADPVEALRPRQWRRGPPRRRCFAPPA